MSARGFDAPDAVRLSREYEPELVLAVCAYAERGRLGPGWIVNRLRSGEMPRGASKPQAGDSASERYQRITGWVDHRFSGFSDEIRGRIAQIAWSYGDGNGGIRTHGGILRGEEAVAYLLDDAARYVGALHEQLSLLSRYPHAVDGGA